MSELLVNSIGAGALLAFNLFFYVLGVRVRLTQDDKQNSSGTRRRLDLATIGEATPNLLEFVVVSGASTYFGTLPDSSVGMVRLVGTYASVWALAFRYGFTYREGLRGIVPPRPPGA